jgi:DNA polymerase-1
VTASLPPPGDARTLWVIDLSGFVFRAFHAMPPRTTTHGEPVNAVHGTIATLQKLIGEHRPSHLAVAIDSKESRRKERYPDYKSSRKERPPELEVQAARVREIAEAYAIPCLEAPGWEADDVIATLVRRAREEGLKVVIASADKDLLQLVGDDVVMWDGMRDRTFGPAETMERLGVRPEQVRDYLALTGDASDDVPGVPSVGPKTAAGLLATFGSLDAIYGALDRVEKRSVREKLGAHRADAELSRELVTLNDHLDVPFDLPALAWGGADRSRLEVLFRRLEMRQQLASIDRWAPAARGGVEAGATGRAPAPAMTVPAATPSPAAMPSPAARGPWTPSAPSLLTSEPALAAFLEAARGQDLAAWTVTDDEGAQHGAPVGLALARAGASAYVPLGHVYLGRPEQLPLATVRRRLEAAEPARRIEHDHKRERHLWSPSEAAAPRVVREDVMLASYLIEPEAHQHRIDEVIASSCPEVALATIDLGRGRSRLRPGELEVERLMPWAASRAEGLLRASEVQRARLAAEGLERLYREVELPLSEVLFGLERAGALVDAERLAALSAEFERRMASLEARCHEAAGHAFAVRSPRALEVVLFDELHLPALKHTKTARSTDHEVLEELAGLHPLPALVLELRMLEKLKGTYLDALAQKRDARDGRVHPRFNQAVAATGRLSSSEPNLQNIPIRTEEGRLVRGAFVAPEGFRIVSLDYSQIELRVLAHVSRDPELLDAYRTNADVHLRTAKALFDVDDAGVTREMRARAKTVNFAVIYGQTEHALARNLKIPLDEAARYIRAFFARYAGVARWLDEVVDEARRTGSVRTLLGRKRDVPGLDARGRTERWAAERVARNTPIQGSAADLMKLAMLKVDALLRGTRSRTILTVHDELVLEVHDAEHDALVPQVKAAMEQVFVLEVPLVVEHGSGATWMDAH